MLSIETHIETPLSGSTIGDFIAAFKALGRDYIAYTDLSKMSGLYKTYKAASKEKIKFIPGVVLYFKDPGCFSTKAFPQAGYFTLNLYPKDQEAYQKLCSLTNKERSHYTSHTEDEFPLYTWEDLVVLKNYNFSLVLCGPHNLLSKLVLAEAKIEDILPLFEKLKDIFPDLSVALSAVDQNSVIKEVIRIKTDKGVLEADLQDSIDVIKEGKVLKKVSVQELEKPFHGFVKILAYHSRRGYYKADLFIKEAKREEKFYSLKLGNVYAKSNKFLLYLAQKFNLKVLSSDNAFLAKKEHKSVQSIRLEGQTLQPSLHLLTDEEYTAILSSQGITLSRIEASLSATKEWAKQWDNFSFNYPWRLPKITDKDPKIYMMELIKKTGRMEWNNTEWKARLKYELDILSNNGVFDFLPYFFPIAMVFDYYKENGKLTGPSRGSMTGSLLLYLMGITHVNPLDYDVDFNRFFNMDRVKKKALPDCDVDLPSRELLVGESGDEGFLKTFFGNKSGQISTRGTVRLKSAIKDVNRVFNKGKVEAEVEVFSENLPAPPQGMTDKDFVFGFKDSEGGHVKGFFEISKELQVYAAKRPKEWEVIKYLLDIPKTYSRHASAFILADDNLENIIPMMKVRGVSRISQYEAKEVESAGLIKYDFLVVSQLEDIEKCLNHLNLKKNYKAPYPGMFLHEGKETFIWKLPDGDEKTATMMGLGHTETTFQTNTESMKPFVMEIKPKYIKEYANILALVRPGPLDYKLPNGRNMAEEYVARKNGQSQEDNLELRGLLKDTYDVIVYQENLTYLAKNVAGMPGDRAETLREHMCKKRMKEMMLMKPEFIEGASKKISKEAAEELWNRMQTFGQYGFSWNHSVPYGMISYATAFLKAHYPLEWWAAVLSNSDAKEINEEFWQYVKDIVSPPDINLSTNEMVIDYSSNSIRSKLTLIKGLADSGMEKIIKLRPFSSIEDLLNKEALTPSLTRKLAAVGVLDSLFKNKETYNEKMAHIEDVLIKLDNEKRALEGKKLKDPTKYTKEYIKYTTMNGVDKYKLQKSILPSMKIDLNSIIRKMGLQFLRDKGLEPVIKDNGELKIKDLSPRKESAFKKPKEGNIVESSPFELINTPVDYFTLRGYFAYVLEVKELAFKKDKNKKRLQVTMDINGEVLTLILWPNFDTQILEYDTNIEKGSVIYIELKKSVSKQEVGINNFKVL
jgi:DNA polymerase III alpha subunit